MKQRHILRLRFCLLSILTFACIGPLPAQTFDLAAGTQPLADLSKATWHFQPGDDPRWANPAFDDAHWSLIAADRSWNEQGFAGYSGIGWYRLRVRVPPDQPLDLAPGNIQDSYEVFVDGRQVGHIGTIPGTALPPPSHYTWAMVAHVPPHSGEILIALRVWHRQPPFAASKVTAGFRGDAVLLGTPNAVGQAVSLRRSDDTVGSASFLVIPLLEMLAGLLTLLLFWKQPASREYLWFGVLQFCFALESLPYGVGELWFPTTQLDPLSDVFYNSVDVALILFFFAFIGRPVTRFARWLLFLQPTLLLLDLLLSRWSIFLFFLINLLFVVDTAIVYLTILALVFLYIGQSRAARRLAIPLLFIGLARLIETLQYTLNLTGGTLHLPQLNLGSVFVGYDNTAQILFILTMAYVLVERFAETQAERTRLSGEFAAARGVQQLLVPGDAPATPGFHVESVYLPAQEVGGDFFFVLPGTTDALRGSLLAVVGDVSGKGLQAAMIVSTILGALRGTVFGGPAEVLLHLNAVLTGHISGFVTCCAALLHPDGRMEIANAGNPAPYRGGRELLTIPGIPLGIAMDASYGETSHLLAPGDRLTFVSDGVIEAAAPATRELFGFDRTEAISTGSASAITEAAQAFGFGAPQADDITVLTITMLAHAGSPA